MDNREYIIAAACVARTEEFLPPSVENRNVLIGMTHAAILERCRDLELPVYDREDTRGFLTSRLRFVNRWEAMGIAKAAGQICCDSYALFSDMVELEPHYRRYQSESPHKAQRLHEFEMT